MYSRIILYVLTFMYLIFALSILIKLWFSCSSSMMKNEFLMGSNSLQNTKLLDLDLIRFNNYVLQFNKTYSGKEYQMRLNNFKASLSVIARLNSVGQNATFGLTKFSDMSEQEFADRMLMKPTLGVCTEYVWSCTSTSNSRPYSDRSLSALPEKIDWREKGVIGPVQDQKQCQACWALSVAGVMEAMSRINNISKEELSAQELLDCLVDKGHYGCRGGNIAKTLIVLCDSKRSVVTTQKYPLTLRDEKCQIGKDASGIKLKSFRYMCNRSEEELQRALVNGPVTAIVNAGIWANYLGGIIQRHCFRRAQSYEHAVPVVGYDRTGDIPYYIIKNSWGKYFGDHGYVKLEMNKNMCGVAEEIGVADVD